VESLLEVLHNPGDNVEMDLSVNQLSQSSIKRMGTRKHPLHFGRVNTITNQSSDIDPNSQSTDLYRY